LLTPRSSELTPREADIKYSSLEREIESERKKLKINPRDFVERMLL